MGAEEETHGRKHAKHAPREVSPLTPGKSSQMGQLVVVVATAALVAATTMVVMTAALVVSAILAPPTRAFAPPVSAEPPETSAHPNGSQHQQNRESFHVKPYLSIRASAPRWRWVQMMADVAS
jgi:hypothetical protein